LKVSIFGLGYVGTVSAGCLASEGHEIVGVDPVPTKVDLINKGQSPIIEAEISELIASYVKSGKVPAAYQKFEAMVLQNFVKNMLPTSDTLYGKGNAGEIWKGMMAEQLGNTLAKDGGVGIAEKMYHEQLQKTRGTGVANVTTNENDRKMALSAVTDFERKTLGTTSADADEDGSVVHANILAKTA